MEKAIKKAIEGGYNYHCAKGLFHKGDGMECTFSGVNSQWTVWIRKDNESSICVPHEDTVLDPLFWQALGKSEGWDCPFPDNCCRLCGEKMPEGEEMFFSHGYSGNCPRPIKVQRKWKKEWHRLIDHLAEGKDAESFFNSLLT